MSLMDFSFYLLIFGMGLGLFTSPFVVVGFIKRKKAYNKYSDDLKEYGFEPNPLQKASLIPTVGFILRNQHGITKEQISVKEVLSGKILGKNVHRFDLSQKFPGGNYTNSHECFLFPLKRLSTKPSVVILNPTNHSTAVAKATSEHFTYYRYFTKKKMKRLDIPDNVSQKTVLAMLSDTNVNITEIIDEKMLEHIIKGADIGIGVFLSNEGNAMIAYDGMNADEITSWIEQLMKMEQ